MSFFAAKLVPPKISRYFRRPTLGHRKLKYFQRFLRLGCQKWLGRWKLATKILPRRCTHARPSLVTHAHSRVPEITLAPPPRATNFLHHVSPPPSTTCHCLPQLCAAASWCMRPVGPDAAGRRSAPVTFGCGSARLGLP
jgi:hypothetical protein